MSCRSLGVRSVILSTSSIWLNVSSLLSSFMLWSLKVTWYIVEWRRLRAFQALVTPQDKCPRLADIEIRKKRSRQHLSGYRLYLILSTLSSSKVSWFHRRKFFAPDLWVCVSTGVSWLLELLKIMEPTNSTKWLSTNPVFFLRPFTNHFTFTLSLVWIRTDFGLKLMELSVFDQCGY